MRKRDHNKSKIHGVHYTPPELAAFLADATVKALSSNNGPLAVLDPACGNGGLLRAFAQAMPPDRRNSLTLEGFETDATPILRARAVLRDIGVRQVIIRQEDFLAAEGVSCRDAEDHPSLFGSAAEDTERYDAVIANPPYVRTQVLGAQQAQKLAGQFKLSGRVDLYHAFTKAMANVLKPGGVLGLLISNRFLTIRSGASLRKLLRSAFELIAIYDLGDTKLFSAAVLPAIVVARKHKAASQTSCIFDRVYEQRATGTQATSANRHNSVLDAMRDRQAEGMIRTRTGAYSIQRGRLQLGGDGDTWSLSTAAVDAWLLKVGNAQRYTFDQIAKVRVGIKTTADEVFIRPDWKMLPAAMRPEEALLHRLITHKDADKWLVPASANPKLVLYPHTTAAGRRIPISLEDYPRAAAYLESHKERLTQRHYVTEAGRNWYEIWVAHQPADWAKPKIVFPDIAEYPRFCLDRTGAIVNGDCYWITLKNGVEEYHLLLILAVANSSFITKFYDTRFHNKLYSGRRRFMTQYVNQFPLPDPACPASRRIAQLLSGLLQGEQPGKDLEMTINHLVWEAFGLAEEI